MTTQGAVSPPETHARSKASRIGIAALNLLSPGLGLVRIGRLRIGLTMLALPVLLFLAMAGLAGVTPPIGFRTFVSTIGVLLAAFAILYVTAIVMSWRDSKSIRPLRWYSRWYALIGLWIVAGLLANLAAAWLHSAYKTFYAPSSSMAPTIAQNDRFLVDMRSRQQPQRGDVIVFASENGVRVSRVAAIGGDVVSLRNGAPMINGITVDQRPIGSVRFNGQLGLQPALESRERLSGEKGEHAVLDIGKTDLDNMASMHVPPNTLFVLGDDRDLSADSRLDAADYGVGMVPVSAILGRPLFIYWSNDHARIGMIFER